MTQVNLARILAQQGPMRSSRLVDGLFKTESISVDAAKQRVSPAQPPIHKFLTRLLPKNEAFLYHQADWKSERFWEGLVRDLRETRSIYGLALYGLIARGGLAQRTSFDVICGSPKAPKKANPPCPRLRDAYRGRTGKTDGSRRNGRVCEPQ